MKWTVWQQNKDLETINEMTIEADCEEFAIAQFLKASKDTQYKKIFILKAGFMGGLAGPKSYENPNYGKTDIEVVNPSKEHMPQDESVQQSKIESSNDSEQILRRILEVQNCQLYWIRSIGFIILGAWLANVLQSCNRR